MLAVVAEWANFLARWIHLIAGISWIGNSFYFMWMDSSFEPLAAEKPGVEGELFMVHGGHFYHVEKQKFRPGFIPKTLHWFKWEATFTWVSGFVLMILLYYATNGIYLIGPESPVQDPKLAVLASLGFLFGTWFVYDAFWNSRFAVRYKNAATAISLAGVVALCWVLCRVFTGRGAYLHLGAIFATCMVLNVWFRILPRQQTMFDEAKAGRTPDYSAGPKAKQRSTHNSYMTLPVLFAMLSNHFSLAHGHALAWVLLVLLCVLGAVTRHMMLQWNYGKTGAEWLVPILATIALMIVISGARWPSIHDGTEAAIRGFERPQFARVLTVVSQRCLPCHSQHPTDSLFPSPPNGVTFETADSLHAYAAKIKQRVYVEKSMPLVNRTNITDDERALLAAWVDAGAETHD